MLRYLNYQIYTNEVPDELSLGFTMLGCPQHCKGCHSSHVWDVNSEGLGTELTNEELTRIVESQKEASCILFFGGDWYYDEMNSLLSFAYERFGLPLALYSGREFKWLEEHINVSLLTYLKCGAYKRDLGGLANPLTNQRIYRLNQGVPIESLNYYFIHENPEQKIID